MISAADAIQFASGRERGLCRELTTFTQSVALITHDQAPARIETVTKIVLQM